MHWRDNWHYEKSTMPQEVREPATYHSRAGLLTPADRRMEDRPLVRPHQGRCLPSEFGCPKRTQNFEEAGEELIMY